MLLMDRRSWFLRFGALAAARLGIAQQPAAPLRITKQEVAAALRVAGLEFTDTQLDMMLPVVNRSLTGFERLRSAEIPLDTEPAFTFHPGLPGRKPGAGKPRFHPTSAQAPKRKTWSNPEELAFLPVTQLALFIKSRLITSTELTRMYLGRLKRIGGKLNSVITPTEQLALEQAAKADEEIRRGRYRGLLHGIPWGAKDLFATRGIPTTWGAEPFQNQVIDRDATVVERLREAGAVLVAKLSMGALAQGGLWFGGMTHTPWNLELTSSGSSAGSAAATAAGLVGFSLGTETLGSIISPSVRCGTVGLRPTYGRVSRYGAMGLSWTMDKIGPICRSVEDCALVLNAIYGPDGRDRTVAGDPFHWEPNRPLSSLRIGVLRKAFEAAEGEEKELYARALGDLEKAGVKMEPVEMSDDDGVRIRFLLVAEAAAAFDDITRDGRVTTLKGQAPGDWPNTFRSARLIPAVEYIRAQRARTLLVEKMERAMAPWDVLVMPSHALLTTTNLTGHPQVVVPCGFVKGLPRGISFLGKLYDEGAPLRVALAFEQATDWHNRHPPL
jgi:Asp-tRNA(Asn)/Glu-tRNA(Gln) amidotransferase A subunit family amidase